MEEYITARVLMYVATPDEVVAWLRLMFGCQKCGALPLQECRRGVGEVHATHLQRGL